MNVVSQIRQPVVPGVEIVNDPADLDHFKQPTTAATIWQKQTPPEVQTWLDGLNPQRIPHGRVILRAHAVGETVQHLCDLADMPKGRERDWLEADVSAIVTTFAELMSTDYVRMRLEVVTTNACRKFHIDRIVGRLVCTYRGTGTQYGISDGNHDPVHIHTVSTGAPILLRGSLWPAVPAPGLFHRSPPIEGSGEVRLVLVLDPVNDLENEE